MSEKELGTELKIKQTLPAIYRRIVKIFADATASTDVTNKVEDLSVDFRKNQLSSFSITVKEANLNNVRTSTLFNLRNLVEIKMGYNDGAQDILFPVFKGVITEVSEEYFSDTSEMVVNGGGMDWFLEDASGTVLPGDADFNTFYPRMTGTAKQYLVGLMVRAGITDYALNFNDYFMRKHWSLVRWPDLFRPPFQRPLQPDGSDVETDYPKNFQFNFPTARQALDRILASSPVKLEWFVTPEGMFVVNQSNVGGTEFTYTDNLFYKFDRTPQQLTGERLTTQPANIQAIKIVEVSSGHTTGAGTISYLSSDNSLRWAAPGDTFGVKTLIDFTQFGAEYIVHSSGGSRHIRVVVDPDLLGGSVTDTVTISDSIDEFSAEIPYEPFVFLNSLLQITSTESNSNYAVELQGNSISYNEAGNEFLQRIEGIKPP